MDEQKNNTKITDSAYSNSCSNSQSRRSSKSTHSGSNSSGSSGYGGKPSTSGCSSNNLSQPPQKKIKDKDSQKKKLVQLEISTPEEQSEVECVPPEPKTVFEVPKEDVNNVDRLPSPILQSSEERHESMDVALPETSSIKDEVTLFELDTSPTNATLNCVTSRPPSSSCCEGFSCVISMHDGVVMYTTATLTTTLGFPKDMWVGRSFIDFVHPRDRNALASHITNRLAIPKNVNGTKEKANFQENPSLTMFCRIRRYRGLSAGFGVKNRVVTYMPFHLNLSFKNVNNDDGEVTYLVIQATPLFSAFKTPNEIVTKPVPFIIRHAANGNLEYLDPEAVPYLGYLPQDIIDKDALHLYHPNDLAYLRQIYESIVKEGGSPRSKPYRMVAQNGDYVRLETEWSSFVNPWSKKVEFVIGKHYIIEGPTNPEVFQTADPNKGLKLGEEEMLKAKSLREGILKILNEILTKPAEVAKQQMSKRCQDLASFMETLLDDHPKPDEEMRLEIHDPDHSYYERDSVVLGGISPHHDYNDSKSSTETPVSYNQLNYNETLQRYFESHTHTSEEYNNIVTGDKESMNDKPDNMSPVGHSGDSAESETSDSLAMVGVSQSEPVGDYQHVRLTESLLSKHNAEMEKELVKMHREHRFIYKAEKDKSTDNRQKKKEHLARCNASFQSTSAGIPIVEHQPHGVKRGCKRLETEMGGHKHHCPSPRQSRRRQNATATASHTVSAITNTSAMSPWPANQVNGMNAFILGVGIPQQMSVMYPMTAVPGMIPMHYVSASGPQISTSTNTNIGTGPSPTHHFAEPAMQCMMYGQAVYGSPFVYTPVGHQMQLPMQKKIMTHGIQSANNSNPLNVASENYTESAEAITNTSLRSKEKATKVGNNEETVDKTDGESSYSSFYSSFFKTESGSAEEGSDPRKASINRNNKSSINGAYCPLFESEQAKKITRRKMEPPWMEQVCVTSELIYQYQIVTKSMDEVLTTDKLKIKSLPQPSLVNEQLGQLYLDLQLEGVAARLTLEEGITSSSSSGEESSVNISKNRKKKREYSKLVMIYEENAPLPPPDSTSTHSTS